MINGNSVYLRRDVQVEPLIDLWYAWSYLIPPHTAARNITDRHLKIMDSYISAPQVHANAVKNPKLLGGPFMDLGGRRVDEIKALREQTKQKRGQLIALSAALAAVDALLQENAKGYALAPLYDKLPEILRGYVELVYDLNNQPSMRILESLLYRSHFYDRSAQSLTLSRTNGDDRPFMLSTPRLPAPELLNVPVPFGDQGIDALFRMKTELRPWRDVAAALPIPDEGIELFQSFLTSDSPPKYEAYTGKGVRWRYFGHACILVETNGVSFLFDPVLSYTYEAGVSRYTYDDLPDTIDYVLITHNHQDHILFETLLQLRHKIRHIVVPRSGSAGMQDPSVKLLLKAAGFSNIIELGELDELKFSGGTVTGLPFFGEHSDLDVRSKLAYLVRMGQHSLMFAADSCNIEPKLYEHLHRELGDVDVLFLGMECDGAPLTWLYGPLLTRKIDRAMDESRRLAGSNYDQAMDIVNRFRCKEVYVYAMGQEPWLNHVMSLKYTAESRPITESNRLIETCAARGVTAERLFGEKEILIEP